MPVQMELQSLIVRPIEPEEEHRWNQLMNEHHYLGFRHVRKHKGVRRKRQIAEADSFSSISIFDILSREPARISSGNSMAILSLS